MGKPFKCNGGQKLSYIGASFFISYLYYLKEDSTHKAWDNLKNEKSKKYRINSINRNKDYYKDWVTYIINVRTPSPLIRNTIGLTDAEIVDMAKKLVHLV